MECIKCGNPISMTDKYFALSDVLSHNDSRDFFLCEECAETTTLMELYMSNKIRMSNNDDDAIEVNAVVVDNSQYGKILPEPEEALYDTDPRAFHPSGDEVEDAIETMNLEQFIDWFQYASTGDGDENTPSTLMGKTRAAEYYQSRIEHPPVFNYGDTAVE